jgi:hypothetical protein
MALALDNRGRKLSLGGRGQLKELAIFLRMVWGVGLRRSWGWRWWRLLAQVLVRNPSSIRYALWMATLYVHFSGFAVSLVEGLDRRAAEEEIRERAAAAGTRASLSPAPDVGREGFQAGPERPLGLRVGEVAAGIELLA